MNAIAKTHQVTRAWDEVVLRMRAEMERRAVHPAQTVVLVPYAQLMHEARQAWERSAGATAFVPRFETTMNWTQSLGAFQAIGDDLRMDAARDVLTAASLLVRSGLGSQHQVLAGRLMALAWSLARRAAAVAPEDRLAWGTAVAGRLFDEQTAPALEMEARLSHIAVAWAASSSYPTDRVFAATTDMVLVLEGFQSEPLTQTLFELWSDRVVRLPLSVPDAAHALSPAGVTSLHAANDLQDEAQLAAASVLAHLAAGREPVALVAVDRVLTRQVRALLAQRGVAIRDETGWKLSTTRAAATLMGLLRASVWDASTDAVMGWLKNAPVFTLAEVGALEAALRRAETREWRHVAKPDGSHSPYIEEHLDLLLRVEAVRETLQKSRTLARWLVDTRTALEPAGQWPGLQADAAGQSVIQALYLGEGSEVAVADVPTRMSLTEFTAWVSQTLEAASFMPAHPAQAQVVILPLSQLLGRALQAVVIPGCDEVRLPVSPEPPDDWTPSQREALGLPSRDELAKAARAAWLYALRFPQVDLLWRTSEGGERLMPSGFVQELLMPNPPKTPDLPAPQESPWQWGADARALRELVAQPGVMPRPVGQLLTLSQLSASAYADLRTCPYRFFALRQLRLQEDGELDTELEKRDLGTWLHSVLRHFHEALKVAPALDESARTAMLNVAAQRATKEMGLSEAEFLPFSATWPRVREGYLEWLARDEAAGHQFDSAEVKREMPLGAVTLTGRIDRVDTLADGSKRVIDYKTENQGVTRQRIKESVEDTQLPFYAALLDDDTLSAAYVNVGEKEGTRTFEQAEVVVLRDRLVESVLDDMGRIAGGTPLPALGEGKACEYCAARGLCRKDFWEASMAGGGNGG